VYARVVQLLFGILPIVVFGLVGTALFAWGWSFRAKNAAIARWPKAPGRVLECRVGEARGQSRDRNTGRTSSYSTFRPEARFEYEVNGQRYESTTFWRDTSWTTDLASVRAVVDRFPVGPAEVLVDPSDPRVAYLAAPSGGGMFLMIFGGAFLFFSTLAAVIVIAVVSSS
jgi:hypothetical protein